MSGAGKTGRTTKTSRKAAASAASAAATTPPPAPAPDPAVVLNEDKARLKAVLVNFFDVPDPTTDAAGFNDHEIVKTFATQKIETFNRDFLSLQVKDIEELSYMEGGTSVPLTIFNRRRLLILLSFFHHACRKASGMIRIENFPRAKFDQYRISEYDPAVPIVPYNKKPDEEAAVSNWLKTVKPNKNDYKEFRDEAMWTRSKEQFLTTLAYHGLSHLVDDKFVVENASLDIRTRVVVQCHANRFQSTNGKNNCNK